uniref:DUF4251 domain-containing protein n=1 Tax=Prevotella sp. GTC17262 TaxID=3236797 RepID=A0AB33JP84_9BACT
MKKLLLSIICIAVAVCSFAQSEQDIKAMAKAYMSVSDSVGIYADIDGSYQLMESIKYSGVKANALGTALSYGIAKTKIKVEFAGATSPYVFMGKAHFRIHFGMVPVSKAQRLYMFSSNYTLRDFAVSRFIVKKNKRQLVQGSYSLWGGSNSGLETANDVVVSSTKLNEGVYDVTVNAKPGEYCIVFNINGVGAYTSVFDFTIK